MSAINTNISAMKAGNASISANKMLGTSMERLSTGKRINSAKDDAAGLAISTSMTSSIRGMGQGIRNANDGIAMAQTAEGALGEVTNMLQRVRELAVQGSSGTYSDDDRALMQKEVTQLQAQITSTLDNTEFNGTKLFDGKVGGKAAVEAVTAVEDDPDTADVDETVVGVDAVDAVPATGKISIQVGANAIDKIDLDFGKTAVKSGTSMAKALAVDITDLKTTDLEDLGKAIGEISSIRADLGAAQNRLESSVNSTTTNMTNMSDARSRIEDTDYSAETTALAKAQILSQASTAMISQANQSQQNVLSLLR